MRVAGKPCPLKLHTRCAKDQGCILFGDIPPLAAGCPKSHSAGHRYPAPSHSPCHAAAPRRCHVFLSVVPAAAPELDAWVVCWGPDRYSASNHQLCRRASSVFTARLYQGLTRLCLCPSLTCAHRMRSVLRQLLR